MSKELDELRELYEATLKNLTSTQERCTLLLEETRRARSELRLKKLEYAIAIGMVEGLLEEIEGAPTVKAGPLS